MTDLKIETNTGPFVPGWALFALYAVISLGSVWLATGWMFDGIQMTLLGCAAIAAGFNFVRPNPVLGFGVLGVMVIFLMSPAGTAVSWRSYVLLALVPLVLRLASLTDTISLTTSVSGSALWVLLRGYLLVAAPAQVILVCLALVGAPDHKATGWLYVVATVLVILTIVGGRSLTQSNRCGPRVI